MSPHHLDVCCSSWPIGGATLCRPTIWTCCSSWPIGGATLCRPTICTCSSWPIGGATLCRPTIWTCCSSWPIGGATLCRPTIWTCCSSWPIGGATLCRPTIWTCCSSSNWFGDIASLDRLTNFVRSVFGKIVVCIIENCSYICLVIKGIHMIYIMHLKVSTHVIGHLSRKKSTINICENNILNYRNYHVNIIFYFPVLPDHDCFFCYVVSVVISETAITLSAIGSSTIFV